MTPLGLGIFSRWNRSSSSSGDSQSRSPRPSSSVGTTATCNVSMRSPARNCRTVATPPPMRTSFPSAASNARARASLGDASTKRQRRRLAQSTCRSFPLASRVSSSGGELAAGPSPRQVAMGRCMAAPRVERRMNSGTNPASDNRGFAMPDELTEAVSKLDEPGRERALEAWSKLREYDRRLCRNYVLARNFAPWRRRRAEKTAQKLSVGGRPPRRLRLPRWLRTALDIFAGGA
jgi:hypothetical protein